MRPPLPTLGPQPRKSPLGGLIVASVVIGGLAGGGYWIYGRLIAGSDGAHPPQTSPSPAAEVAIAPAIIEEAPRAAASPYKQASIVLLGALETALVAEVGAQVGPALAQVVNRALVWWVDVPSGLMRNDTLDVVFEERTGEEPLLHAIRFKSAKNGKTHSAFRFHAAGESFARFYEPSGDELEQRLTHGPLDDYEQVTSLLRDGRGHKGVDFKAPVGTPVKAPFNATVTRKNWNFKSNGNCVELQESGGKGRRALFLHLSELPRSLKVGDRVTRGAVIAASGNSGRSFAPHLHYQLMRDEQRALDPFESHEIHRRSLPPAARAAFDAHLKAFEARLGGERLVAAP